MLYPRGPGRYGAGSQGLASAPWLSFPGELSFLQLCLSPPALSCLSVSCPPGSYPVAALPGQQSSQIPNPPPPLLQPLSFQVP